MAIQLSLKEGADILMGTDPDCDRMGVAAKNPDGGMTLITGNQIGAMLADYRISILKAMGWIIKSLLIVLLIYLVTFTLYCLMLYNALN